MPAVYPFEGVIQHYAWGGYNYLPEFLDQPNPDDQPWAELWMGAHPKGPGKLTGSEKTLAELIEQDPSATLGPEVASDFDNKLPFLFKVLDVREMLSIQVHPTKAAAEAGFAREETDGPARDAPNRNYRDDNHKPELGVALTDFYLLHGFRSREVIASTLQDVPGWSDLSPTLESDGVAGLYARVMHADQEEVDRLLAPLAKQLAALDPDRDQAEFWAKRAFDQYTTDAGHYDRGIFSIYWFNLVKLTPGQGIFQDAGIPHAYLEGVCIELMANSDNVLRGGLTPKHIDVPELLDKTRFDTINPQKLTEQPLSGDWTQFPTPAPDFELRVARPKKGHKLTVAMPESAAILLLVRGGAHHGDLSLDDDHRTVFVPRGGNFELTADSDSVLYLATVGNKK